MKIYAVVEHNLNPWGEDHGEGRTLRLFMSEEKAKEYKKWVQRDRIFGSGKGGHFNSKIKVKAKTVVEN
jgi:hypothetical protein